MLEPEVPPISAQEERELRRVYDLLCCYQRKHRIQKQLDAIAEQRAELEQKKRPDTASKVRIALCVGLFQE
jgi:hypothetical protein